MTKPACAYARRSTDDQDGSLPAQWAELEALARREGYTITERFEDDGISGTSFDRPGLQRLIHEARNGAKWTYVLVWDRSRLGRPEDPREAIAVTFEIERSGKKIVPVHGHRQSEDPLVNTLLEAVEFSQAGQESIRKSRDVLRGQRESAKRGSLPNGKAPYGCDAIYFLGDTPSRRVRYLTDGSKQVLSLDGKTVIQVVPKGQRVGKSAVERSELAPGEPEQVATVCRIFDEFNAGGTARTIAYGLNRDRIPSPRGKTWGRNMIVRILGNPAYCGMHAWNRHSWAKFHVVGEDGQITRVSNPLKKMSQKPREEWTLHEDAWEGIVSREAWESAYARLHAGDKGKGTRGKGARSQFLVSGLLECSCGFHMAGSSFTDKRSKDGRRYEYYRCIAGQERGSAVCEAPRIQRRIVDDYVEGRLMDIFSTPVAESAQWAEIERQLDEALAAYGDTAKRKEKERRLTDIDTQLQRLVQAVAAGALDLAEIVTTRDALRKERAQLEAELSEVRTAGVGDIRAKILRALERQGRDTRAAWARATMEQKKAIVRRHVVGLRVDHERKVIRAEFRPFVQPESLGVNVLSCS